MKKALLVALLLVSAVAVTVYARDVYCPVHSYASCYDTGQVAPTGSGATKWHCTCGDDVWVAPEPPPSTQVTPPATPPAAPIISPQTQQQLNTSMANLGAAVAAKRERKKEERFADATNWIKELREDYAAHQKAGTPFPEESMKLFNRYRKEACKALNRPEFLTRDLDGTPRTCRDAEKLK
jgi:hypothetical protein